MSAQTERNAEQELARYCFLQQRDGAEAAKAWALRTMRIYRKSVLNPQHFASKQYYRRMFIESYLFLKRWAAS